MRYYVITAIIALAAAKAKAQAKSDLVDPNQQKSNAKVKGGIANRRTVRRSSKVGYAGSPI